MAKSSVSKKTHKVAGKVAKNTVKKRIGDKIKSKAQPSLKTRMGSDAKKKRLLGKVRSEMVGQAFEKDEVVETEIVSRKRLDPSAAPGIDIEEKLKKKWKQDEEERSLDEPKGESEEGMGIEKDEAAGEEPYPEIGQAIKEEADEEEDEDE
jgi:hypothetical protein